MQVRSNVYVSRQSLRFKTSRGCSSSPSPFRGFLLWVDRESLSAPKDRPTIADGDAVTRMIKQLRENRFIVNYGRVIKLSAFGASRVTSGIRM